MKLSCENTKKIINEVNEVTEQTVDYSTKEGCNEYLNALEKAIKKAKKEIDKLEVPKTYELEQIENELRNNASAFINVGDVIKFKLITDEEMTVVCIGKNHDNLQGGGKAGLTFAPLTFPDGEHYVNKDTNKGGWANCHMRNKVFARFFKLLPKALQELIVPVVKLTGNAGKLEETIDRLFPLSIQEYTGNEEYYNVVKGEGEQYEWFKQGNKLTDASWWTRSPYTYNNNSWSNVNNSGNIYNTTVYNAYYVCPCFCIK